MRGDTKQGQKIKIDFNLLMSGTWVLEKKGNQTIHKFEKDLGVGKVVIYNALDVPSPLDSKVLDFLMLKAQENNWEKEISIGSLRQIAKEVGIGVDRRRLNRLKLSFKILANTRIEFHNCFIDTGVMKHFEGLFDLVDIGILSGYSFRRTKARGKPINVKVVFDDDFITLCKYSLGYKLVPFAPINGLRDTAYALYKWAWRWYNAEKGYGERWIGDGKKLVEWYKNELNSTGKYKFPSEVLRRVRSAIKQLNDHPEVPFSFLLKEENGTYKLEIYRKEGVPLKREIPFDQLPGFLKRTVISLIEREKHIREPFALARSMSWKELETLLKGVIVVPVPKDIWDFITNDIMAKTPVETEKKEFQETVLGVEDKDDEVLVAFESSKLKKKSLITTLLDTFTPNWRSFIQEAVGYLKEVRATKI